MFLTENMSHTAKGIANAMKNTTRKKEQCYTQNNGKKSKAFHFYSDTSTTKII
jgi:hypothetical protein